MKLIKSILLTMLIVLLALSTHATNTFNLENSRILFEQNFESVSDAASTGWTYGGESMTIESDVAGKFIRFSQGQTNGRSAQLTWGQDIFFKDGTSVLPNGCYQIRYDFSIAQGSNNQYNSEFTVFTNHEPLINQSYRTPWFPEGYWQNYLFDMSQVADESYGFAIDGGTVETVREDGTISYSIDYSDYDTFEQGKWYTVTLDVDVNARTVRYSVVSLEGEVQKSGIRRVPERNVDGEAISMYAEGLFIMMARYQTVYEIDNIKVYYEISGASAAVGDHFKYEGIWFTVIDPEAKTCETMGAIDNGYEWIAENQYEGDLIIPSIVSYGTTDYSVVGIGNAGFIHTGITSVKLPNSIKYIESGAFYECVDLTAVICDAEKMDYIGDNAFKGDVKLISVVLPKSLDILGDSAFKECSQLKSIVLPDNLKEIKVSTFVDCSNLETIVFPPVLKTIGWQAFWRCSGLIGLEFPDSLSTLEGGAFAVCHNLKSVSLPESLSSMEGEVFIECYGLKDINYSTEHPIEASEDNFSEIVYQQATLHVPNATLADVQAVTPWHKFVHIIAKDGSVGFVKEGDDFEYEGLWYTVIDADAKTCRTRSGSPVSLGNALSPGNTYDGNLAIPSGVLYNSEAFTVIEVGAYGFSAVDGLTSVWIPESVTKIGIDAFYQCHGLASVSLPGTLMEMGQYAFSECTSLTNISLPESLTSIAAGGFSGCSSLSTFVIPSTIASIGDNACSDCAGLKEITIPDGVVSLGNGVFSGCVGLEKVQLPNSLESAGNFLFSGCDVISYVNYRTDTPLTMNIYTFEEDVYEFAVLNMSETPMTKIQTTDPWLRFQHIIASDGMAGFVAAGDDFQYYGIWYTVIDADAKTCITKEGHYNSENKTTIAGNDCQGDIIIPEKVSDGISEYTVIGVGQYSFFGCAELTGVEIPSSVTFIGENAFYECINLRLVDISDMVTSIESSAFSGCTKLSSIKLPKNLTQIKNLTFNLCSSLRHIELPETLNVIGDMAFSGCSAMIDIDIPKSVWSIGMRAFEGCTGLTVVSLPDALTSLSDALFMGCSGLVAITIPKTITSIGRSAFEGCSSLAAVAPPDSVITIGQRAFWGCKALTSAHIPQYLTVIGNQAYYGCSSLTSIHISQFLTSIGEEAFMSCSSLNSLIIDGRNLTSIGDRAFHHCNNLMSVYYMTSQALVSANEDIFDTDVYFAATLNMPNVTLKYIQSTIPWNKFEHVMAMDGSIGFDFEFEGIWYTVIDHEAKTCKTKAGTEIEEGWLSGNSITGDIVLPSIVSDGMYEYRVTEIGFASFTGSSIESIVIPESVTIIGERAFNECTLLSSVSLPDNIVSIEMGTFYGCKELSSINMPESLDRIRGVAFYGCEKLSTLTFPEKLSYIGAFSFQACSGLTSIVLPASLSHIGMFAFGGTGLLDVVYYAVHPIEADGYVFETYEYDYATLHVPNVILSEVLATTPWNLFKHIVAADGSVGIVEAGDEFEYQGIWYTVIDPEAMTCKTKDGKATDGQSVAGNDFNGNLVIPATVSDGTYDYTVMALGRGGFNHAIGLTSVVLPETITSIPESAFDGCSNLTSISIPETVTSISVYAFSGCSSLAEVKLPDNLTSLGYSAFGNCSSLTSIVIPVSLTQLQNQTFIGCSSLRIIEIPATVESFDYMVFGGCAADVEVTYRAEVPVAAGDDLFGNDAYINGTLNMPYAPLAVVQSTVPWNKFKRIVAGDGSAGFVSAGDDFEYKGIWYTVVDAEEKTCKTKDHGNDVAGNLVIPAAANYENEEYRVIGIGDGSFSGSADLRSVSLPTTIESIGNDAFADCGRLTSVVWTRNESLSRDVIDGIGNPNLLLYVDSLQFAPEDPACLVVADGVCEFLDITPGYAFTPVRSFTANRSRMVKEFTQKTLIGVCAGWETIVLPFDADEVYSENIGSRLTPFAALTDIKEQRPFWLYEADETDLWKEASGIKAGVPYIISMPNNHEYVADYNIEGRVEFSNDEPQLITPETTAPYAVTWASGRQFRSLWLPLSEMEAETVMGLNVGIEDLTDDEGTILLPGSAFHEGVTPKPLEAYVTRIGAERAMKVMGGQSTVIPVMADSGLEVRAEHGAIYFLSATDRKVYVFTPEGALLRRLQLKAGEAMTVDDLTPGIYIAEGRKVIVR
ncbi:MAG: leucine-rich repeat domain-containing protein [Muribaculaceae bacterium]|nr:leucine-rich repeat domain-containing protein [Muribaculaceae bacterium]